MKNKFLASSASLNFALAGLLSFAAFSTGASAQTTNDGPGPSDQPSAPMEVGTPQQDQSQQDQSQQGQVQQDQSQQDQTQQDQTQGPAVDAQNPDTQSPNAPAPDSQQPADAQPTEPTAQPGGPSGEGPATTDRGVGRISLIHGDVSTQRGDSGDWSAATLNQPMMAGDKLSTGDGARAELQLDFANILRLGPNSKANIANFTQKNIQVQLGQGIANYTVLKDSDAEPEIDTPNVAVHPAHRDGVFRIEVRPDGDTILIVRKGEVQIATPQGSAEVRTGEMATIRGDSNSAQYKISNAPDRDDWDQWNSDRDHMIQNAQSWRHTNRYYTGTQDLDAYGSWKNVPDYGDVWVPNEPSGWAPYRNGNWTYEPYYGWTWVGYEPWGWAPYHYGRWMWYGGSWGWWPGAVGGFYRPFWSPAYVSFWGWGGGWGFGLGLGWGGWGGFGWLPLGPGDWFHPWWGGYGGRFGWVGRGWGYNRFGGFAPLHAGMRFSNVANMHDAHIGGALSTVGAGRFGAGHVTAMAATHAQLGGARMMAGNLPVVPSRASLSASGRAAAASTVRGGGSEHFYGSHSNVQRASFQQETSHLQQSMAQNHVNGFTAGSHNARTESASRGTANGSMGKPSAGTSAAARDSGGRGTANAARSAGNSNTRSFAPSNGNTRESSSASRGANSATSERGFSSANANSSNHSFNNEPERGVSQSASNRDGFRSFSSNNEASREGSSYGSANRGGSYWNRTAPSSFEAHSQARSSESGSVRSGVNESRGYSDGFGRGTASSGSSRSAESSRGSYSRPQLDMRQPIARSPYGGSYGNSRSYGGYGGYHAPSYGGSRPSYGGSHSSGHVSAPSSGHSSGGHSFGGGGHSSGGGHSGGGHGGGHR